MMSWTKYKIIIGYFVRWDLFRTPTVVQQYASPNCPVKLSYWSVLCGIGWYCTMYVVCYFMVHDVCSMLGPLLHWYCRSDPELLAWHWGWNGLKSQKVACQVCLRTFWCKEIDEANNKKSCYCHHQALIESSEASLSKGRLQIRNLLRWMAMLTRLMRSSVTQIRWIHQLLASPVSHDSHVGGMMQNQTFHESDILDAL